MKHAKEHWEELVPGKEYMVSYLQPWDDMKPSPAEKNRWGYNPFFGKDVDYDSLSFTDQIKFNSHKGIPGAFSSEKGVLFVPWENLLFEELEDN